MPAGRPPIWDDPEAFENKANEYFETQKPITWSGLALYLGFSSRDSLNDYAKKPEFSDSVKKAFSESRHTTNQTSQNKTQQAQSSHLKTSDGRTNKRWSNQEA